MVEILHPSRRAVELLLWCGIGSAIAYIGTDLVAAAWSSDYSFANQAVSELFAIDAPTSHFVVLLFSFSSLLLLGFAAGLNALSVHDRPLRWMAGMFTGSAIISLVLWNAFPMHLRGSARSFTDTMHLILATNPFVLATLALGILAFRGWFRSFSIATLLVVLVLAIYAFRFAPALNAGLPTPGMGLTERAAQYCYQAWQAALALLLLGRSRVGELRSAH